MNNENYPSQLSKVKVTVNSNLNSIGLIYDLLAQGWGICLAFLSKGLEHGLLIFYQPQAFV